MTRRKFHAPSGSAARFLHRTRLHQPDKSGSDATVGSRPVDGRSVELAMTATPRGGLGYTSSTRGVNVLEAAHQARMPVIKDHRHELSVGSDKY